MNQRIRDEILTRLSIHYAGAKIELNYTTPFQLLVAVLLSAQATDKGVNRATKELFLQMLTPKDALDMGEDALRKHIRSIGLYQTKAKHVMKMSQILEDQHAGGVPRHRSALEALPGVGRKTANVVLNVLYGKPTIAVDTHIFRVANRTHLAIGKTPEIVEKKLLRVVPMKYKRDVHQWLIQLGRYTCVARRPKCAQCPVFSLCEYPDKVL